MLASEISSCLDKSMHRLEPVQGRIWLVTHGTGASMEAHCLAAVASGELCGMRQASRCNSSCTAWLPAQNTMRILSKAECLGARAFLSV